MMTAGDASRSRSLRQGYRRACVSGIDRRAAVPGADRLDGARRRFKPSPEARQPPLPPWPTSGFSRRELRRARTASAPASGSRREQPLCRRR